MEQSEGNGEIIFYFIIINHQVQMLFYQYYRNLAFTSKNKITQHLFYKIYILYSTLHYTAVHCRVLKDEI